METRKQNSYEQRSRRNATSSYSRRTAEGAPRYRQRSTRKERIQAAAARAREERELRNRREYSNRQRSQRGAVSNYGAQREAQDYRRDRYTHPSSGRRRQQPAQQTHLSTRQQAKASMKRSQAAYAAHTAHNQRRGWNIKRILLFVLIIAVVIFAAWWFLTHPISCSKEQSNAPTTFFSNTVSYTPTPIMAQSSGVDLHCAVGMDQLTEILIHNASYTYALPITTQLTEATNTEVQADHGTGRDKASQPLGDNWMTGEFIRCYRSESAGPTMSAIDCGGPVGATVYSPVKGKVVKVVNYDLYGNKEYPDIRVHIQPEGRPDLDVVLIHLQNVPIKEGDSVEAGETVIGHIRDVYAYIGDSMQLKKYTEEGDNGNHTHIQVNNANDPTYTALKS